MIRRIVVALVALLIAAVGGVLTFLYASGADARAMANMSPAQVLIVAEPIAAGTPSESLSRSLAVSEIPSSAVVPGGVTDLADVAGMVTVTDLQPGEQLLAARFEAPEAIAEAVEVPSDMHELSLQLESRRVIGGELRAGDTIGIFVSASLISPEGQADVTRLILHKVLVTAVTGASGVVTDENGDEVEQEAEDTLMVTLALSAADAEQVVWGLEFGTVWLSLEGAEVPEDGTRVVTAEEVFQ